MQYLSQRLASKPSPRRGAGPPEGALRSPQLERILDATEKLVAANGCNGTSIEAIVKEAGVSSVTFYEFFDGKEACFAAAFDRAVAWGVERIAAAIREAGEVDGAGLITSIIRAGSGPAFHIAWTCPRGLMM